MGARTLHERWASGVCGIADGAGRCDEFEPGGRAERHRDGYRAIERHDGRRHELCEGIVERCDAYPVRDVGDVRPGMACSDRSLQRIRAERAAQPFGSRQCREAATDQQLIPSGAILIEQQDRLACRPNAGR